MSIYAEIGAERTRQQAVEGWTPEHDDEHSDGELACAGACYAMPVDEPERGDDDFAPRLWPWSVAWWKPGDGSYAGRRRELVKAAALIVAEIERLDRAAAGNLPTLDSPEECWSVNGEEWRYNSLDDLLETEEDIAAGGVVWRGEANRPTAATFINASTVIDDMGSQAWDFAGEFAEDFPDVSKESIVTLEVLLSAWAEQHCDAPTFYQVINAREHVITDDDLASHNTEETTQ